MIQDRKDTVRVCPVCGQPLPDDAPRGLCPACLAATAAGVAGEPAKAAAAKGGFDYELLGEIAHGGMGVVHYARQISLNRPVALKMIRSGQLATPAEVERFRTEAEAAANLHHPNIVPIYEIGEHDGQRYFSMKLVEGGNLGERIAAARLSIAESVRLEVKIARAVHHAHQRGVLHRDLKPSNILLDEAGEPYLTDFGLAKILEGRPEITQTIAVLGTPHYMAPEQATGGSRQITIAADVYSLGTILYELLAGRPPFAGASTLEILAQVKQREPDSVRKLNPAVDRDLDTICLKCLEKEPARRYASAEALAQDLERWLEHRPIEARPVSTLERAVKWTRRNPAVSALGCAVALILLGGVVAVCVQWRRAEANFARAEINASRAQASASESRDRLVRLNVANGVRLLDEGDSFRALVWFAEALKLDRGDPQREADHRLRIATTMQHGPRLLQLWVPGGPVHSAEFSPDGRFILTASDTNCLRIWNTDAGTAASPLLRHSAAGTFEARWSRDARRIVSVGADSVCVWDAPAGRLFRSWPHPGVVHGVFAPEADLIATASHDGSVRIWNGATGEQAFSIPAHSNAVVSLEFSRDGQRLLSASDRLIRVTDVSTGSGLAEWPAKGGVRHAAFDGAGERVVTAHWERFVRVWSATTGRPLTAPLKESTWVNQAVFSPDGQHIATAAGGHVGRVYTTNGAVAAQLSGHKNVVVSVAFSDDGKSVVTCSFDGTARVHSIEGKSLAPPLHHGGLVTAGRFHPDGRRLLTASTDGTVRLWEIGGPPVLDVPFTDPSTRFVNAMRDGSAVILQNSANRLEVFDTENWRAITRVELPGPALSAWISKARRRLMTVLLLREPGRNRYRISTWNSDDSRLLTTVELPRGSSEEIRGSPTCSRFALANARGVEVFACDGSKECSLAAPGLRGLEFSRDDTLLLLNLGRDIQVIDLATGAAAYPPLHHAHAVFDAEFSRDSRYIASACQDAAMAPRAAFIWNARNGKPLGQPMEHADGVFRAAFSTDGTHLVTASEDGTGRLWSVPQGSPLTPPLRHPVAVYDAAFSVDGKLVATASHDMTARVWDTRTGEPLTPRLKHEWRVEQVLFLGNSRYLLTRSVPMVVQTNTLTQRMRLWELPRDARHVEDLVLLTKLLSGHAFDGTGALVALDAETMAAAWRFLSHKYPASFSSRPLSGSTRAAETPVF